MRLPRLPWRCLCCHLRWCRRLTRINAVNPTPWNPPSLSANDSLEAALKMMQDTGEEHVAVVEDRTSMKLIGFLHEIDVMLIYNRALIDARREERGEM